MARSSKSVKDHRDWSSLPHLSLDNQDIWEFARVQARYRRFCKSYTLEWSELEVHPYDIEREWTSGILDVLIERMKRGDLAAAEIGLEMVEEDRGLAFGPIIKSNIPRAMAKCVLTEEQKERVRKRVVQMLLRPFLPKEFRQYAWLARRVGMQEWVGALQEADRDDAWVAWYVDYLLKTNPPRPPYSLFFHKSDWHGNALDRSDSKVT